MNVRIRSLNDFFKLIICVAIDGAGLFFLISLFPVFVYAPFKTFLATIVLIIGLVIINGLIWFSNKLFERVGVVYSTSIVVASLIYAVLSNLYSILFLAVSSSMFISFQLLLFAVYVGVLAVFVPMSRRAMADQNRNANEQSTRVLFSSQILSIESALNARKHEEGMSQVLQAFKLFKERVNASTPFGRESGHVAMTEVESDIWDNLHKLHTEAIADNKQQNVLEMKALIDDTRRLVMNREALNIK